ncbi:ABC transporter substrate-binding protein [Syntrophomonas erecta subsp. sporosyntropha]
MLKKPTIVLMILAVFLLVTLGGCQASTPQPQSTNTANETTVTIAIQYGLAYAPLQIVKEKELLEKYLPGVKVVWKQLGTGPVIRDAMVTGEVDIGFMGVSPFLIGWDKGAEWKIAVASGSQPLGLLTYRENIKILADFKSGDRIATPALASIQHILLSMQAEKELDNARALDNLLVSVTHPDAAVGLLGKKDITAHFSSPPYLFKELDDPQIKQILDGEDAYGGEFTFIYGVATDKFHDSNPAAYSAFVGAFNEAVAFINNNPREAARLLAPRYNLSEEQTYRYLTWKGTNYTSTPYGLMGMAEFMHRYGFISKMPQDLSEIAFENVQAMVGKRYGELSAVEKLQWRNGEPGENIKP